MYTFLSLWIHKWSQMQLFYLLIFLIQVFWCSILPLLDICSVIAATAALIMQRLQEACGSRLQSYFHVAAHLPICSFSAAQTRATWLFTYCCQSRWDARKWWWLHLSSLLKRINNFGRQEQLRCGHREPRRSFPYFSSLHLHCCGGESHPRSPPLG